MSSRRLAVLRLGQVRYMEAYALQRGLSEAIAEGRIEPDLLLLLEHEPTITLGRGTRLESLPISPEELQRQGLTVVEVDRGGDVTWHGPGQLVGYPIMNLTQHREDLHWYLRQVEEALILALGRLGIPAERNTGYTGVWTEGRKIASIGIHVRQWVTTHGFALNVANQLNQFGLIVPCGIPGVAMTSVERELGRQPGAQLDGSAARPLGDSAPLWDSVLRSVVESFGQVFDLVPFDTELQQFLSNSAIRGS
jgi:lipoyl(octanoyl) transferase